MYALLLATVVAMVRIQESNTVACRCDLMRQLGQELARRDRNRVCPVESDDDDVISSLQCACHQCFPPPPSVNTDSFQKPSYDCHWGSERMTDTMAKHNRCLHCP